MDHTKNPNMVKRSLRNGELVMGYKTGRKKSQRRRISLTSRVRVTAEEREERGPSNLAGFSRGWKKMLSLEK